VSPLAVETEIDEPRRVALDKGPHRAAPCGMVSPHLEYVGEIIVEYGYLLDATTLYMSWSDQCRIRCRSHLYGLLCQPEKELAS
jgi:hypothetical protein